MTDKTVLFRSFSNTPASAAATLSDCMQFIRGLSQNCDDIEIALAEALNNVVDHAYPQNGLGEVEIVRSSDSELQCIIKDFGTGIGSRNLDSEMAYRRGERGRGMTLMGSIAHRLKIDSTAGGTCLSMMFKVQKK